MSFLRNKHTHTLLLITNHKLTNTPKIPHTNENKPLPHSNENTYTPDGLHGEAGPLTVRGHELLEGRVLLDLELDNVPVLAHHLHNQVVVVVEGYDLKDLHS